MTIQKLATICDRTLSFELESGAMDGGVDSSMDVSSEERFDISSAARPSGMGRHGMDHVDQMAGKSTKEEA